MVNVLMHLSILQHYLNCKLITFASLYICVYHDSQNSLHCIYTALLQRCDFIMGLINCNQAGYC